MAAGPPLITRELVDLACGLRADALPPETRTAALRLLRDGLGVLYAGLDHPTVAVLVDYLRTTEPQAGVPLLGHDLRCSPADAALVYGCAMHCLDFEPMFLPPTHAVSPVLGALVALNQHTDLAASTFVEAFVAGLQLQASLRQSAAASDRVAAARGSHFPFERRGFHPPGTVGPLGSALASALALGLGPEQCAMAVGLAASRSGGLAGNIGTMAKASHCGEAARAGLESALWVRHGFTASTAILETASGWGQVFGGNDFAYAEVVRGMRDLSCFTSPGFAFKKWPTHTAMQVAIDAALALAQQGPVRGRVQVSAPVLPYCDRPRPRSTNEARFSFQYNVAVALAHGTVGRQSFTEAVLHAPATLDFLGRIDLVPDPDIPADFDRMWVALRTDDGRTTRSSTWPGHWRQPASEGELCAKFVACLEGVFPAAEAQQLGASLMRLPAAEGAAALTLLLRADSSATPPRTGS